MLETLNRINPIPIVFFSNIGGGGGWIHGIWGYTAQSIL